MTLSGNLLKFRQKANLSAPKLAKRIGVTKQAIYQYEKGESVPGQEVLAKLAQVLGVSISDLYNDKPEKSLEPTGAVNRPVVPTTLESVLESEKYILMYKRAYDTMEQTMATQLDILQEMQRMIKDMRLSVDGGKKG